MLHNQSLVFTNDSCIGCNKCISVCSTMQEILRMTQRSFLLHLQKVNAFHCFSHLPLRQTTPKNMKAYSAV